MKSKKKLKLTGHLNDHELLQVDVLGGAAIKTINKIPTSKNSIQFKKSTKKNQDNLYMETEQNFQSQETSQQLKKRQDRDKKAKIDDYIVNTQQNMGSEKHTSSSNSGNAKSGILGETQALQIAQKINSSNPPTIRPRKKKEMNLKEVLTRQKIAMLKQKFIQKSKRNLMSSTPAQYGGFEEYDKSSIWQKQVFDVNDGLLTIMGAISIFFISTLLYIYSLQMVFKQIRYNTLEEYLQAFAFVFFLAEIIFNCLSVKTKNGKKITKLGEVMKIYIQNSMLIDICNLIILLIALSWKEEAMIYFRMFIITKIPQCADKLQRLEAVFIKTFYNEQYWSLVKVVLFNFIFAHVLAIILSAMARIQGRNNWHTSKGISSEGWSSQYIWGYYWAVNIMLTVGFGDLSATNSTEALCLIFIQIISVMCLAYNINWVGTLISNIRAQDIEKTKRFKTFKQLNSKYELPAQLQFRISNYIEESVNIRKKFNIEQQQAFVESLPQTMKKEYLKQSNKTVFQHLPFFAGLVNKTIFKLSQKIQTTISHPQQILKRIEDAYNLLILREGKIGFTVKKRNCNFNDMVIDKVKVNSNDAPFILNLQFLTRKAPNYETKSLQYSVICSLPHDQLLSILRESHMDYMLFCFLRDKNKSTIDEFQVLPCSICQKQRHTKFTCPKLHYSPITQMVIYKQNYKANTFKSKRNPDVSLRLLFPRKSALKYLRKIPQNVKDRPYTDQKMPLSIEINKLLAKKFTQYNQMKASVIKRQTSQNFEDRLINQTAQLIKQEFDRFKNSDHYDDEIWTIQSDLVKDYKEYFPESNSSQLQFMVRNINPLKPGTESFDTQFSNVKLESDDHTNLKTITYALPNTNILSQTFQIVPSIILKDGQSI